jgi:parallel beta-helix repeat protein
MAPTDEQGRPEDQQLTGDVTEWNLAPGTQIRQYKITGILRSGGAGRIYLALDLASGKMVAIKKPLPPLRRGAATSPAPAAPAEEEARILRHFRHPNVARLIEVLEDAGKSYLVLEYVEGMDLETFLDKAGPGIEETALRALLLPIAAAVHELHRFGYLHRDIKPANLRIRHSGEPVLIDFGAAGALKAGTRGQSTWSTLTDGYAAPEFYSNDTPEGPWSDVYGLAAIAYRAISGKPPPPAPELLAGLDLPPASSIGRGRYSSGFLAAIDAGLALTGDARPRSAALWAEGIADVRPLGEKPRQRQDRPDQQKAVAKKTTAPPRPAKPAPESDPFPPTVQVRRRPLASVRPPSREPVLTPSQPAKRPSAPWGALLALLLVLAGLIGAGGWLGWPYYLHNIKDTWVVDPAGEGDARGIMEAITQAKDGATLQVAPATYVENLVITRPVHLISSGPLGTPPVIAPSNGRCLMITAATGIITGFAFQGPPSTAAPSLGQQVAVDAQPAGLPCIDIAVGQVIMEAIEVTNPSGPGIIVRDGAAPLLQQTVVADTAGHGIIIAAGAAGRVTDSTILRSGGAGLAVMGGATPEITGTKITESGAAGVIFAQGAKGFFVGNAVAASAYSGIEIVSGAAPEIRSNTITQSGQAGIYVHDFGQGRIESNEVAGSGFTGLLVDSSGRVEVLGNHIKDSAEHGVLLLDGASVRLVDNVIIENGGYGIGIESGAQVELTGNSVQNNQDPQIQRDGEARPIKKEASP